MRLAPSSLEEIDGLGLAQTRAALRAQCAAWRADGARIGFVPTMGALHEGHLSLIDHARAHADRVVVSIFVNPTQFAPHEDFDAYPRTLEADAELLRARGCDLLYAPAHEEIYAPDASVSVDPGPMATELEGKARPHFFHGVATVVTKLLNQVRPDCAVFGEKDYQQLLIIRRVVRDLDLDVEILAGPTQRDDDGLALSSRNAYLSAEARPRAAALFRALCDEAQHLTMGGDPADTETRVDAALMAAGFESVDYVALRHADTLAPLQAGSVREPARLLATARLEGVRLLDNVAVTPSTADHHA